MYKPPFIITSTRPTLACFGNHPTLEEARTAVTDLQQLNLCLAGNIGAYRDGKFVQIEQFEEQNVQTNH